MWKINPQRKREIWKNRLGEFLYVYWDVTDHRGIGFWNDDRQVEQPEYVCLFSLLQGGWSRHG